MGEPRVAQPSSGRCGPAGDILRTAVAPTFTEIGQLAAIAAIRTALNYFLGKEIERERDEVERCADTRS